MRDPQTLRDAVARAIRAAFVAGEHGHLWGGTTTEDWYREADAATTAVADVLGEVVNDHACTCHSRVLIRLHDTGHLCGDEQDERLGDLIQQVDSGTAFLAVISGIEAKADELAARRGADTEETDHR